MFIVASIAAASATTLPEIEEIAFVFHTVRFQEVSGLGYEFQVVAEAPDLERRVESTMTCVTSAAYERCDVAFAEASLDMDIVFHEYGHGVVVVDRATGAARWNAPTSLPASAEDLGVVVAWAETVTGVLANGQSDGAQQQGRRTTAIDADADGYTLTIFPE